MTAERRVPSFLGPTGAVVGVLFILALHATLWWLAGHPEPRGLNGDEIYYGQLGQRMAAGERPEQSLLWPPLYGYFLAALAKLSSSLWIVALAQSLLLVVAAWLLARIARALSARPQTASLIAGMALAFPPLVGFTHYLWPEVLHLVFFLGALWIVLERRHALGWAVLLGLVLGLALLTKSLLSAFVPVLLVPLVLGNDPWRQRLLRALTAVVALSVAVAPTILANHRQSGLWVIANSGPFNLWVGLNERSPRNLVDPVVDGEYVSYMASAGTWSERDRILRQKIRRLITERGWLSLLGGQLPRQYCRLFNKDSYLTDQLPGGALSGPDRGYQGTSQRVAALIRWLSYGFYAAFLALAAWGFWVRPPPRGKGAWLVVAFLVYNLGLFFWLHVKSRFRIQMLPIFFIYAGLAIEGWWLRHPLPEERWRMVLASLTGLLLLWLAFGACGGVG